jgi:hypothetical protein
MANDCSERVCQFGVAHVDSPKGDLDASGGALTGPGVTVVANDAVYPYGTSEQFPEMVDTDGNVLTNTAHAYYECSNKGICDRSTGTCACFDGYDGSACQRQSCPTSSAGVCSGHGVCESISTLSSRDSDNIYKLWDDEITMGCRCDGGYTGPDCSQKICKFGADPLYFDDSANIRYSNFTYHIYTVGDSTSSDPGLVGNYSIWFEDRTGESWQTRPIDIDSTCTEVTDALEGLPNNVIPKNSVRCYQHPAYASTNVPIWFGTAPTTNLWNGNYPILTGGVASNLGTRGKFTLAFPSNPGYLKQIQLNKYLDGARPTLYTKYETTSTLNWFIYANGFTGEDTDYVPDKCEGVQVTLASSTGYHYFTGLTAAEKKLLKICLGDSNGDSTDNTDVYNWDYGDNVKTVPKRAYVVDSSTNYHMHYANPHLVKLIDATQDIYEADPALSMYPKTKLCSSVNDKVNAYYQTGWCADRDRPGFYAIIFYDSSADLFKSFTPIATDFGSTTNFYVYTTTGYLQRVSPVAYQVNELVATQVTTAEKIAHTHSTNFYTQNVTSFSNDYYGNIDCETNPTATGYYANDCVNKGDKVFFLSVGLSSYALAANPKYLNMYTVQKISTTAPVYGNVRDVAARNQIALDWGVNAHYAYDNGVASSTLDTSLKSSTSSVSFIDDDLAASTFVAATAYVFHPPTGYNYVAQCSNRGLCDTATGVCQCYPGYTGDACGMQDALSQ